MDLRTSGTLAKVRAGASFSDRSEKREESSVVVFVEEKEDQKKRAGSRDHFPPGAVKAPRSSGSKTLLKAQSGKKSKKVLYETGLMIKERKAHVAQEL